MNIALWIVAGLLAAAYLVAGLLKSTQPKDTLQKSMPWVEDYSAGTVRLIGTDEQRIVAEVSRLMDDPGHYASMANAVNPYGDGRAAERSVAAIQQLFSVGTRLPDFA